MDKVTLTVRQLNAAVLAFESCRGYDLAHDSFQAIKQLRDDLVHAKRTEVQTVRTGFTDLIQDLAQAYEEWRRSCPR